MKNKGLPPARIRSNPTDAGSRTNWWRMFNTQVIALLFLSGSWILEADTAAPVPATAAETNHALTLVERLLEPHLKATHEARAQFAQQRSQLPRHGLYQDFRAVIPPLGQGAGQVKNEELLEAARKTGSKVVLIAEAGGPKSDAWRGLHEGVLFIPGAERENGVLSFPECTADGKPVPESSLRFLSHVEERYDAPTDGLAGMEICNTYGEAKPEAGLESYLKSAAVDTSRWQAVVKNFQSYPDEFFAAGTDYAPKIFAKWDEETGKRPFTGIGVNDAQQKLVLRGVTFDRCEKSFQNLATHVLAQELTEADIRDSLTNGHVYVAHDWLRDPTGFNFGAVNNLGVFNMGDGAPMQGSTRLTALTPIPAKLRLMHKGVVVQETTGTNLSFTAKEPGPYRLEAWLNVDGEDRPWIFSNPVYLKPFGLGDVHLPSMAISPEVEAHKNITYREGAEEEAGKHKLDIYSPKDKTSLPVLFFIHGGSWRSGDRSNYPPLGNRYAKVGFVTVVPSYRLAPKYPHPAQIQDVAAAFAWTVRHIAEYGGDTNRIYVSGHSAGGHLAALLSLDESQLKPYQLSPKNIRGVLALSGVYNLTNSESQESVFGKDPEVRRAASPLYHVKAGAPPFLVTYCQWDYFSLPAQAREFHRALRQAGVASELVYIPGQNHISEIVNVPAADDPLVAAELRFMK